MSQLCPPLRLLLIKSVPGSYASSIAGKAGYAKYGNPPRWHAVTSDKPAPKGAPTAGHPHAAGAPSPASHFTDDQWAALKLPDSNTNAPTFNKQLQAVKDLSESGDVTALLGMSVGSNSYGGKLSKIINHLLGLHGSLHQVAPGQKAGTHAAVQSGEALASHSTGLPGHLAPAADPKAEALAAAVEHLKEDATQPGMPAGEAAEDKALVAKLEAAQTAPVASASPLDAIPWDKIKLADANVNAASVNKKLAAIKAAAYAGDVAALEGMKFGSNNYAKKLQAAAASAVKFLKDPGGGDATVTPTPDPTPSLKGEPDPAPAQQVAPTQAITELDGWKYKQDADGTWMYESVVTGGWDPVENGAVIEQLNSGVATAPAPASSTVSVYSSVFHNTQTGHNKFWSVSTNGKVMKTSYGKLGTMGQTTEKVFASAAAASQAAKKLEDEKKAKGYKYDGVEKHDYLVEDVGPNDGDTKPGADGSVLTFKDGRWHKQAALPAAKKLKPSEAIALGAGLKTSPGNKAKLKAMACNGDVAGLADFIATTGKKLPASKMLAKKMLQAMIGDSDATSFAAAAPPPAPKPAAPEPAPVLEAMGVWQQVGPQAGSNPGGKFKDESGQEWYCKFPKDADIARSEVLAAKLYAVAGLAGQHAKLITKDGKVGIASKWTDVTKAKNPAALAAIDGAQSGFAVDAWLGNWDVVGMGYDNLQIGADGKAVRVDAGGSLEYRAQGEKKPFGDSVDEIDTLRDAVKNPQAAKVFGKMTNADITASVAKVLAVSDAQIRALVAEFGPGDDAGRKALANTLIARKADLLARFPKAGKAPKKMLDPAALPVNPADLPKPHDFENWNGAGQGLSSKAHVNKANAAVEYQMLGVAQVGNLTALKAFHYQHVDKESGAPTGAMIPIASHPSKHVVQFNSDLVQILEEVANPPEPLKVFHETDVGTLASLSAAFPPKPFGTTVDKVASNEKLGFWVMLGAVAGVAKFAPKAVSEFTATAKAAAKANFSAGSALARHFIASVQSSGSYNDLFRNGKTSDHSGNNLTDVAKAALAHATPQPEGTSLYRWQKMSKQMVEHVMSAKDGSVFQATGPMCTSYSPTATKGFGDHCVVIRYAAGAKAVDSFGSGKFIAEKEVTTLPNSRFVILSKKMVPSEKSPGKMRLELELLMLPPDIGL